MLLQSGTQPSAAIPVSVFYSYSHKDERLKERLVEHLAILKREGFISDWHDRRILAGEDWSAKIDKHLDAADIILLLVSASFIASDYCYGIEMRRALNRHANGKARVIPVILRPVSWQVAPFARFQALPRDGRPVVTWRNQDEAFADVAEGVRNAVADLQRLSPRAGLGANWVLRLARGRLDFDASASEQIMCKLRTIIDDRGLTLIAIAISPSPEDGSAIVTLSLEGPEPGFLALRELFMSGDLSSALGVLVESLYTSYGATISTASAPAGSKIYRERQEHIMLPSREFIPPLCRGIYFDPGKPRGLNFIVDTGHSRLKQIDLNIEKQRMIANFLAALTIEEKDLWVNLSAFESNRMIPPVLGGTELGRCFLATDCALKRFSASLLHPDCETGRSYWDKVYTKIYNNYGRIDLPVSFFQKIWLVSDKAIVYEKEPGIDPPAAALFNAVSREHALGFVVESHFAVRCEEDLLASSRQQTGLGLEVDRRINDICRETFKEQLLPIIEREVNQCENFRDIQQAQQAVVLAAWFKNKYGNHPVVKSLILNGPDGVNYTFEDGGPTATQVGGFDVRENREFYEEYLRLFQDGIFKCTRKQYGPDDEPPVMRLYFSGGLNFVTSAKWLQVDVDSRYQFSAFDTESGVASGSLGIGGAVAFGRSASRGPRSNYGRSRSTQARIVDVSRQAIGVLRSATLYAQMATQVLVQLDESRLIAGEPTLPLAPAPPRRRSPLVHP